MKEIEGKDIVFIISGSTAKPRIERILRELREYFHESAFNIIRDEKELDRIFVVEQNVRKLYVAVGGDKTVRKVMEHILGTEHLLGIIPIGSVNGFARQLGIRCNIKDAVSVLKYGEPVLVNVLKVNGCYGVHAAGLGFDAGVAYCSDRMGFRGFVGYVLACFRTLWSFNLFSARILGQSIKEKGVFWMIAIINTRQYGNSDRIATEALFSDSEMEIVLVKPFPLVLLPSFLFRLFTSRLKPSKYVKYIRTTESISISCTKTKFHIDGDPVENIPDCIPDVQLKISLIHKAIRVMLPAMSEKSEN